MLIQYILWQNQLRPEGLYRLRGYPGDYEVGFRARKKSEGAVLTYTKTNKVYSVSNYASGQREGAYFRFDTLSGRLLGVGWFQAGKPVGTWVRLSWDTLALTKRIYHGDSTEAVSQVRYSFRPPRWKANWSYQQFEWREDSLFTHTAGDDFGGPLLPERDPLDTLMVQESYAQPALPGAPVRVRRQYWEARPSVPSVLPDTLWLSQDRYQGRYCVRPTGTLGNTYDCYWRSANGNQRKRGRTRLVADSLAEFSTELSPGLHDLDAKVYWMHLLGGKAARTIASASFETSGRQVDFVTYPDSDNGHKIILRMQPSGYPLQLIQADQQGVLQGPVTQFDTLGRLSLMGRFTDGCPTGLWYYFYPDGQLKKVGGFACTGNRASEDSLRNSGAMAQLGYITWNDPEYFMISGDFGGDFGPDWPVFMRHGKWVYLHPDGSLMKIEHYERGVLTGMRTR